LPLLTDKMKLGYSLKTDWPSTAIDLQLLLLQLTSNTDSAGDGAVAGPTKATNYSRTLPMQLESDFVLKFLNETSSLSLKLTIFNQKNLPFGALLLVF